MRVLAAAACLSFLVTHSSFPVHGSPRNQERGTSSEDPSLRFMDYTDGYIWTEPVDEARRVDVIPLAELHPSKATDAKELADWAKHADDLAHPLRRPNMSNLAKWRSTCAKPR